MVPIKNNRKSTYVKSVIKAELTEKNIRVRIAAVILLIVLASGAFAYALSSYFSSEPGWVTIQAEASSGRNCSNEFVFMYCIGAGGASATLEKKALISLYTAAAVKAYQLFNNDEIFVGVKNIAYINKHPNEVIEVDEVLYNAFSLLDRYNCRSLYLAPVYAEYDNMFAYEDDFQIAAYDPFRNDEIRSYYAEVATFASSYDAINIELLGENRIMLRVSADYQKYAAEHGITDYIDFFWMKNAFIIDYIANVMIDNNYTLGSISSYNGFVRNLDGSGNIYSYHLYDRVGNTVYPAGVMKYTGPQSIVYLRNYRMTELDNQYYYELTDGETRTSFIDIADGLCKSSKNDFVCYSKEHGCAEILLQMIPVYITDTFREEALASIAGNAIYAVYCEDSVIYYNDSRLTISDLYEDENVTYTTLKVSDRYIK